MEGFLIIVAIYVVITVVGAMQKKQKEELRRRQQLLGPRPGGSSGERPATGLSVLDRALQELQRVEAEAKAAQRARAPQFDGRTAITFPLRQRPGALTGESDYDEEATGEAYEGQEDVLAPEAVNLDDASARMVEERQRSYEVVERAAVAPERALPAPGEFESKIVSRIVTTLSVAEEPAVSEAALHVETRRAASRRVPLARFATGRARDAIVLSEILQRPLGERM
jgi:hypothetical protein